MNRAQRLITSPMCRALAMVAERGWPINSVFDEDTLYSVERGVRWVFGARAVSKREDVSLSEALLMLYLASDVLSECPAKCTSEKP